MIQARRKDAGLPNVHAMDRNNSHLVNLLLVEDDPIHAKLVRRALRSFEDRLRISHVMDGQAAMDSVFGPTRSGPDCGFDMILLDLRLPKVDGFEVLRAIKTAESLRSTPVIIISTTDRREEIERCYDLGANAFVVKPARFDELISRLGGMARFWLSGAALPRSA